MSRPRSSSVAKDFDEVLQFFEEQLTISKNPPNSTIEIARKIHGCTYTLIAWKFRLGKLPTRGRIYLDEIASDALQVLPQVMSGYSKTAKLLMRGMIENTLRHIYFYDHPVEFTRINKPGKWRVTVSAMFDFVSNHPEFFEIENKFDAVAKLSALYSELSMGVHGRSVQDLETRTALKLIKFDSDKATQDLKLLERCTAAVNFALAIFHHEKVCSFSQEEKGLIMRTMPTTARRAWKEYDPSAEMKIARS